MFKIFIVLVMAGMLAACSGQGGSASAGASAADSSAAASDGAGASEGPSGSASAACTEAFAPIAEMSLTSIADLGDLTDEITPTVTGCESVADWVAGAEAAIGADINPNAAKILLDIRCADNELAETEVCVDLAAL